MDVIYRQTVDPRAHLPQTEREAIKWLDRGNQKFARLLEPLIEHGGAGAAPLVIEGDFGIRAVLEREPEPRPFGVVLGCADSRVPIELVFGRAVNDLFVVRVAGNTGGSDTMASIAYAVDHFSSVRVVLVLGHGLCGTIAAGVDAFLKPKRFLELATAPELRALVDRIQVSVRAAAIALEQEHGAGIARSAGYPWALHEVAVTLNAAYVAYNVRAALPQTALSRVAVVYGIYDVITRRVSAPAAKSASFAPPPRDANGFRSLAYALVRAQRIRDLLRTNGRKP